MDIRETIFSLQDLQYRDFHASLVPNITKSRIIGVRIPVLRNFAKEILKEAESGTFLSQLPHQYYDEDLLHAILISEIKSYKQCMEQLTAFLPYVDNWGVCDIIAPKIFKKHRQELFPEIEKWIASKHLYTSRFGMRMLMIHFLDQDFKPEYLELPARVKTDEYYWMMMQAWFYATALAKQWEATIPYLEGNKFSVWVHNKTIQKAIESYRITDEQKQYLRTLRRK